MHGKIIKNETEKLTDYLNDNYPEIAKSIKNEKYILDFDDFDVFTEITFKNKVVGFVTTLRLPIAENIFLITDAYILPEFRGHNLLFELIYEFQYMDNVDYYPLNPTKAFIHVLLKNDYAFKLSRNLVVSYWEFMITGNTLKNPKIKRFYTNSTFPIPYKSDVFDMDLCSVMFRDPFNKIVKYDDFFGLLEPRSYDKKKYKTFRKFKRVNEKYIDDKFRLWHKSQKKIMSFYNRKELEFKKTLDVDYFFGSEDKLDNGFVKFLKTRDLSIEDGFKIRKHVVERLKTKELSETSYRQRVNYLTRNISDIDRELDFDHVTCPFCGTFIPDFAKSCLNCGFNVEHVLDNLGDLMYHNFVDDVVEIKENDEHYDLKLFFNEHMRDYDFDEFLDYYNEYKNVLDLEDIKDMFLEEKLIKSRGKDDEYETYFLNIMHYMSYYFKTDKLDLAFVKLIQLMILISSNTDDKKSEIEALHLTHFISVFDDLDYDFDVDRLFSQAVETFRIEKYNNNHEEILKQIKRVF